MIQQKLHQLAESNGFNRIVTAAILLAGLVVGMETYPWMVREYGRDFDLVNDMILAIFVLEVFVRMGAHGRKPWRYFYDPWNVFDFLIVLACVLPFDAQYVAVLRLARVLRVLKLVHALPKLQMLVSTLLKSLPSIGYVALLLLLLFYIYAVAAVFLFGANDPVHFGHLPLAMLSLFRVVTGEDWTDVMYIQMFGCDQYGYEGREALCTDPHAYPAFGAIFFVTFMLFGAMIILNLFIGVVMGAMEEAKAERSREYIEKEEDLAGEHITGNLAMVELRIIRLHEQLEKLEARLQDGNTGPAESGGSDPPDDSSA